jgi:hypothetical protein
MLHAQQTSLGGASRAHAIELKHRLLKTIAPPLAMTVTHQSKIHAQDAPYEGHPILESKLDHHLSKLFNETLCSREPESLHGALIAEVRVFRELRSRLSARLDQGFDERLEKEMMAELESLWTARRVGRE